MTSENASKALELLFRAEQLNPRDPRGWFIKLGIVGAYMHMGRFDEAIAACKTTLDLNPRNTVALRMLAACLAKEGRESEAARVAREVLAFEPQLTLTKLRARSGYVGIQFLKRIFGGIAHRRNTRIALCRRGKKLQP
jgi:tetratricopeptide (TPR) repeat protein